MGDDGDIAELHKGVRMSNAGLKGPRFI
jgi:hypothetical protein